MFAEASDVSSDYLESNFGSHDLGLTKHGSDLLLKLKALQREKKELAFLLDSMRSQLNSTIQLQQQYESEWQQMQSKLHQQLETKDVEKGEMRELLRSTTGATETITSLVTELQEQLESAKFERLKLQELLESAEDATKTVVAQRVQLQTQLETNEREKLDLREQLKNAKMETATVTLQLESFKQQLESTKSEKLELQELLKSTSGATESISTLVVELRQQLEATKLERTELATLLDSSETPVSKQVAELRSQLENKTKIIDSLELQLAQAHSASQGGAAGLHINGASSPGHKASESETARAGDELTGPAVKKKFTKLYRAYERERSLRREVEAQLAKTEEQRLLVAKSLQRIEQELADSQPATVKQKAGSDSQFAAEKQQLTEKIAALHAELLSAHAQETDVQEA